MKMEKLTIRIPRDYATTAEIVLAALRQLRRPEGWECQHCDPDVGFICPECGLELYAGDLARAILKAEGRLLSSEIPLGGVEKK
jgi:hypothetical protein